MKHQKKIHLALQGGGAHGAFTWGVLDELLEDGRVDFEGICATSAGSMNAIVLTYGKMLNGNDGAREALHKFWLSISNISNIFNIFNIDSIKKLLLHTSHNVVDTLTHLISPYQFNPFNYNLLRNVIESQVDFDRLKKCNSSNLFISTTNVRTGKAKIFDNAELSIDVIMASTCLPYLFQAVKIQEEYYWDGGYMGNPAIFPLFYHKNNSNDVMIVHINPIVREELPTSASKIMNRINEITFNSSLIAELRAVAFVNKLKTQKWLKEKYNDQLKHILIHAIRADEVLIDYDVSSKFDTNWQFLLQLKNYGKIEAKTWLKKNFKKLGKESTVDLYKEFLTSDNQII